MAPAEYPTEDLPDKDVEEQVDTKPKRIDLDAEFGGPEARKKLERRLLWKIDMRMSILVVIYILNYVRHHRSPFLHGCLTDINLFR